MRDKGSDLSQRRLVPSQYSVPPICVGSLSLAMWGFVMSAGTVPIIQTDLQKGL